MTKKGKKMSEWYERLKEIRFKRDVTQYDLSKVMDAEISTVSRYESGKGAKALTRNLKRKLSGIFTPEEIAYIETGDSNIVIDKNFGVSKVEEDAEAYCEVPKDIAMIMEVVGELNTEQRRDVLRYVLEISSA